MNGEVNPPSEVIDSLVAQHFNNCGFGGFVQQARYQAPMANEMNNVSYTLSYLPLFLAYHNYQDCYPNQHFLVLVG